MKYIIPLILLFVLLPSTLAIDRIIKTNVTVSFDVSNKNLTVTYETEGGTENKVWHLAKNNGTNFTDDFNEQLNFEFVRDIAESETCVLYDAVLSMNQSCNEKVEAYDRLMGQKEVKNIVIEEFVGLSKELENITADVTNHLSTCQSQKASCESQIATMFSAVTCDEQHEDKLGYLWVGIIALAIVGYYNRDKIGGVNKPPIVKNQPHLEHMGKGRRLVG